MSNSKTSSLQSGIPSTQDHDVPLRMSHLSRCCRSERYLKSHLKKSTKSFDFRFNIASVFLGAAQIESLWDRRTIWVRGLFSPFGTAPRLVGCWSYPSFPSAIKSLKYARVSCVKPLFFNANRGKNPRSYERIYSVPGSYRKKKQKNKKTELSMHLERP